MKRTNLVKKWLAFCLILLSTSSVFSSQSIVNAGPSVGITVCNWKLNENSGSTCTNSIGAGYSGTLTGTTWTKGVSGSCLNFNGTSSKMTVANGDYLNYTATQRFSISAWIYIPTTANKWQGVITKGRDTSDWYGLWISSDNKWVFGSSAENISGGYALGGSWYHVAIVQDGTNNKRYVYVNGSEVASGAARNATNASALVLGGCDGANEYFSGKIDEVTVYSYKLSQATIADQYRKYTNRVVGKWLFDEGSGTSAKDTAYTGTTYNATIYNGTWEAGKNRTAVGYNGTSTYASVTSNSSLKFSEFDSYTISAWVKVPVLQNRWQGVITKGRNTNNWYGLWISSDNKWVYGGNGSNITGSSVKPNQWQHIAMVQNGYSKMRYLYIDGSLAASGSSANGENTSMLMFGGAQSVSEYFSGRIDEVILYNYSLSTSGIITLSKKPTSVNVLPYSQQPYDNLCWATCASMVTSYFKDDYVDRKLDYAKFWFPSVLYPSFNQPGTDIQISASIFSDTGIVGKSTYSSLSFNDIMADIDAGKPIVAYIDWNGSHIGHFLVIRGYRYQTSPYIREIEINDPWDGKVYTYDYDYFLTNIISSWTASIRF